MIKCMMASCQDQKNSNKLIQDGLAKINELVEETKFKHKKADKPEKNRQALDEKKWPLVPPR